MEAVVLESRGFRGYCGHLGDIVYSALGRQSCAVGTMAAQKPSENNRNRVKKWFGGAFEVEADVLESSSLQGGWAPMRGIVLQNNFT